MTSFVVTGPYDVPTTRSGNGARYINETKLAELLSQDEGFNQCGCYVFGVKASKGSKPIYVGMTVKRTIGQEAFNHKNRLEVSRYLNNRLKARLQISIVYQALGRGARNRKCIPEMEGFLIGLCTKRNPDLINLSKRKQASWSIKGVVRSGAGKLTQSEAAFRLLVGA